LLKHWQAEREQARKNAIEDEQSMSADARL
jgi:hypothetical protein